MKYLTHNEQRQKELAKIIGEIDAPCVLADFDHEDSVSADITVIDKDMESLEISFDRPLVTYPFVVTDVLNAIGLFMVHSQLNTLSQNKVFHQAVTNLDLMKRIFLQLGIRRIEEIEGLRVEARYNYGNGGFVDTIQLVNKDKLWLSLLVSTSSFRLASEFHQALAGLDLNPDWDKKFKEKMNALKHTHEEFYYAGFLFHELSKEWSIAHSPEIQVIKENGFPVSFLSYGASRIKKEAEIPEIDLLEFSFQAVKKNYAHDVTIVNFFERAAPMRMRVVS